MRIELNGEARELSEGATLADAVRESGAGGETRGVAVALDGEVVPRGEWESTPLAEGRKVESGLVTAEQSKDRRMFVAIMAEYGFANYRREWWHFTFNRALGGPSYDFPIRSPQPAPRN